MEGDIFTILTDHKPLAYVLETKTDRSPRQTRQMEYIAQFTNDIRYISGNENTVADMLSRLPEIDSISQHICFRNLQEKHELEISDRLVDENFKNKYNIKMILIPETNFKILCEITKTYPRPYIPKCLRKDIFNKVHSLSHPGFCSSKKMIQKIYFWPGMDKDIKMWVKQCINCQKSKITIHTKSPIIEIPIPQCRFEHIHMDIVGPLPVSKVYKYLLTIIDRTTRWPEAYPLLSITSETIVEAFIQNYISRFGIPLKITVDRGTQFTSSLFSKLSEILGIQKIHTSAYHPQANGMVERFHRQLKASIIASNDPLHWIDKLHRDTICRFVLHP